VSWLQLPLGAQQVDEPVHLLRHAGMADAVRIAAGAAPVAEALAAILRNWPAVAAGTAPARLGVAGRPGRYRIESPWLETPQLAETPTSAACALVIEMARSWLEAQPGRLCLHCAAFESDGRLIVLAGTNRAGKSTLAAALGAAGARLYCDDMLPLTPEGLGIALGVPPRLRLPLPEGVADSLAGTAARAMVSADDRYGYALPPGLAAHADMAPLGGIVLLDRLPAAPTRFHPVARNEALAHLLLRNLYRDIGPGDAIARLLPLAEGVPAIRMVYSDIDDAVGRLLALHPARWPEGEPEPGTQWDDAPAPPDPVDPAGLYRHAEGVATHELDGELFAAHPQTEEIYRLNTVAAVVWELFSEPTGRDEVVAMLMEAFAGEAQDRIAGDVDRLMAALASRDLIRLVGP